MSRDLFRDDLSTITPQELLAAVAGLQQAQIHETYNVDYKQEWNNDHVKHVAAMANTIGGIILVGVRDETGLIKSIDGVQTRHELTTQITNAIATSIMPIPEFTVVEKPLPSDSTRRVAVIRVRATGRLHLVTKQNLKAAYVRFEDTSVEANAMQLRSLIEREEKSRTNSRQHNLFPLHDQLHIKTPRADLTYQTPSNLRDDGVLSDTYLKIEISPQDDLGMTWDHEGECWFKQEIETSCRVRLSGPQHDVEESRDHTRYQIDRLDVERQHPTVWVANSTGHYGYISQSLRKHPEYGMRWSLEDTIIVIGANITLVHDWWYNHGYVGDAHLQVNLRTGKHIRNDGSLIDDTRLAALDGLPAQWLGHGSARSRLTFAERTLDRVGALTRFTIMLLRNFGLSVPSADLQNAINTII